MKAFVRACLAACLLIVLSIPGLADGLRLDPVQGVIRPGRAVLIGFDVPRDGHASLVVHSGDAGGPAVSVVAMHAAVRQGRQGVWWNGTYNGVPAPEGEHVLVLSMGEETASVPVTIGERVAEVAGFELSAREAVIGTPVTVRFRTSCAGTVRLLASQGGETRTAAEKEAAAGEQEIVFDGSGLEAGEAVLSVRLEDRWGETAESGPVSLTLTPPPETPRQVSDQETVLEAADVKVIEEEEIIIPSAQKGEVNDQSQYTPSFGSPYVGWDNGINYWTTPMNITDEDAVWHMLTSPVTVVDTGKKNAEKTQVVIRAEPSEKAEGVGVVTCVTQGVHVLENLDNGWSLIECYSSSFHDSRIKAWNMFVQGYVQTSLLKTTEPDQEMGLVVDKLTQRMYIFREGHLFSTLLVSTGLVNARQPYNETRSGEFLLQVPSVGDFRSDNLTCAMGIRFNGGDLIHEVPHMKNRDGSKNYSTTEYKLGTRGSHGCIRVQRRPTPEGTNMLWIWRNKRKNIKIVIWEDWQGRQLSYPAGDTQVYISLDNPKIYHSQATCQSDKKTVFEPISYADLESDMYASLERCEWCTPPMRRAEIDAINALHAPGGDHDPILTEARKKQASK